MITPSAHPPFPEPGSVLGPSSQYFTLGRLGRGTFCSIHRCVDLSYSHARDRGSERQQKQRPRWKHRTVAAKVELGAFANSGVLDGEATVLRHLSASLPDEMVPHYLDYVRQSSSSSSGSNDGGMSAIIMEYLPGEDMHHLRDRHVQTSSTNPSTQRRISTSDAVYLTADVMLPLLRSMHDVGVVHRDVKPSNCVRTGTTSKDRNFKMVDFGLSKSFVVPKNSAYADERYRWNKSWQMPPGGGNSGDRSNSPQGDANEPKIMPGCLRRERPDAEFRGTSMYASLRVHQSRDYCRRDDVWGLLYVFCDLIAGGLPWMSHAANRDRNMCRILKEVVHGERQVGDLSEKADKGPPSDGSDKVEELLFGAEYHLARHRREAVLRATAGNEGEAAREAEANLPPLPEPLGMSRDGRKVDLLRKAFRHVSKLGFADEPHYDLIRECIKGFDQRTGEGGAGQEEDVAPIDWDHSPDEQRKRKRVKREERDEDSDDNTDEDRPIWELVDDPDPLASETLAECEQERQAAAAVASGAADGGTGAEGGDNNPSSSSSNRMSPEAADMARLPLPLQLRLAQAEYNACHSTTIPLHVALRDWMALAIPLAFDVWDTAKYERGNHRTNEDGFRNELYLKLLERCMDCARAFGSFRDPAWCYIDDWNQDGDGAVKKEEEDGRVKKEDEAGGRNFRTMRNRKRRKITTSRNGKNGSCLVALSTIFFRLGLAIDLERERKFAPPPAISFGSSGETGAMG